MTRLSSAIRFSLPNAIYVDFTIKFKETDVVELLRQWADQHPRVAWDEYDEKVSMALLSNYPVKDIGLLLIHGPLPAAVTSYNADNIFNISSLRELPNDPGYGFGLVFSADDESAHVQFGDSVQIMSCEEITTNYRLFITGMQFPSPPDMGRRA